MLSKEHTQSTMVQIRRLLPVLCFARIVASRSHVWLPVRAVETEVKKAGTCFKVDHHGIHESCRRGLYVTAKSYWQNEDLCFADVKEDIFNRSFASNVTMINAGNCSITHKQRIVMFLNDSCIWPVKDVPNQKFYSIILRCKNISEFLCLITSIHSYKPIHVKTSRTCLRKQLNKTALVPGGFHTTSMQKTSENIGKMNFFSHVKMYVIHISGAIGGVLLIIIILLASYLWKLIKSSKRKKPVSEQDDIYLEPIDNHMVQQQEPHDYAYAYDHLMNINGLNRIRPTSSSPWEEQHDFMNSTLSVQILNSDEVQDYLNMNEQNQYVVTNSRYASLNELDMVDSNDSTYQSLLKEEKKEGKIPPKVAPKPKMRP